MAGVRGDIGVRINLTQTGAGDLGTPKLNVSIDKLLTLASGTAATNQANILFADTRTIASSSSDSLDLAGVLSDAFGATITAAEVVAIFVSAAEGNTNNVNITRVADTGFVGPFLAAGDGVAVKPGEWQAFVSQSGWAVTSSTGDILTIGNSGSGTSVTYDIIIVGRTVAA
ncbi:hypothetical protein [Sphingomonas soli]|uniref:hypothetical protein n=1 Tax=Sphingomonas soli TaxID=266127 RepID=UPI00082D5C49|nr:hypothetical protein [Sphingomonas soli]